MPIYNLYSKDQDANDPCYIVKALDPVKVEPFLCYGGCLNRNLISPILPFRDVQDLSLEGYMFFGIEILDLDNAIRVHVGSYMTTD